MCFDSAYLEVRVLVLVESTSGVWIAQSRTGTCPGVLLSAAGTVAISIALAGLAIPSGLPWAA